MRSTLVILLGVVGMLATGCVSHRAEVAPATPPAEGLALGAKVLPAGASQTLASPVPLEVPVTLWRRDAEGNLFRADALLRTPTPWWQRFPSDVVTDAILPGTYDVTLVHAPQWTPAGDGNIAGLEERARAAGYAAPLPLDETR